tara:strand:+ start:2761 stop:4377 length:1617 start_codon:yes stop_codon:yes gene_type:complete
MTHKFKFSVPIISGDQINFCLQSGEVLYLLGANGSGKSSLVTRLFAQNQKNAKRISAHRQTWFESNALDITPFNRQQLGENTHSRDAQPEARYKEWNAAGRASMTIYDLMDADMMQARNITRLVRSGETENAERAAQIPSPIEIINNLMRLSNIPIAISVGEGQRVFAKKNGGDSYSVAELSDGERNAFLIAAEVLTAQEGALVLIDEPERHLHRSIISPLLRLLFDQRDDCAFIVSTHEPLLPLDTPKASTLLVRSCEYQNKDARAWTADMLVPGAAIDDELKGDILGSRRKMLFVEGTPKSLDAPLYSILFPQVSIVPKDGCREVEYAVRGLRGAQDIHWISAFGIVDNDQRSPEDVARLKQAGIWALSHYSVESFYFHPKILSCIAKRQAGLLGGDEIELANNAITGGIAAAKSQRDYLIDAALLRSVRAQVMGNLPNSQSIRESRLEVKIDVSILRAAEESRFDTLISNSDWDGLLMRYPLRHSSAFGRVVDGLKIKDVDTYRAAVLQLLQDDPTSVNYLRNLLDDLYSSLLHE